MKLKRLFSLLLVLTMVMTLLPMAIAAGDETTTKKSIMLGTSALEGAQKSNVYYGNYYQSNDKTKDPIKWRVLANDNSKIFLLADKSLDSVPYNTESKAVTWNTSTIRTWLNDTFKNAALSSNELSAVADTEIDGDSSKLFLPSKSEVSKNAHGFYVIGDRMTDATEYAKTKFSPPNCNNWWLRDVTTDGTKACYVVYRNGNVYENGADVASTGSLTVRPAMNLSASNIIFTSPAVGGKSNGAVTDYTGSDYKLTVMDTSRNGFQFTLEKTASGDYYIDYRNAKVGENEYISYIIKDSDGNITYYGKVANVTNSNDVVKFEDMSYVGEGDKLYIFNEQCNGDYQTDYASFPVIASANGTSETIFTVKLNANGGTITEGKNVTYHIKGTSAVLPTENDITRDYYIFKGWYEDAAFSGDPVTIILSGDTGDKTYYAKWEFDTSVIEKLQEDLKKAQDELAEKATTEALNQLQSLIGTVQEALEDGFKEADKELKNDLEAAIATAKTEAINKAKELVEDAKTELNNKINEKADSETVNAAISNLQTAINALDEVKNDYITADNNLKDELEESITAAYEAAIAAAKENLENQIANKSDKSELTNEVSRLESLITAAKEYAKNYTDGRESYLTSQIQALETIIAQLQSRYFEFKVEGGYLYVRYNDDESDEWTNVGYVKGYDGKDGKNGFDGYDGKDGKDGITPHIRINENNEWEVSYDNGATWTSLGVKATGEKGDKGDTGAQGEKGEKGDNGADGINGADGKDGKDGKDGSNGTAIAALAIGGVSLISNLSMGYVLLKKKKI